MNARSKTAPARTTTGLRLSVDELAEITQRAEQHHMTRTDYMIAAALDRLEPTKTVAQRLEALEHKLERLEATRDGQATDMA